VNHLFAWGEKSGWANQATRRNEESGMRGPENDLEKRQLLENREDEDKGSGRLERNFGLEHDETRESLTRGHARVKRKQSPQREQAAMATRAEAWQKGQMFEARESRESCLTT